MKRLIVTAVICLAITLTSLPNESGERVSGDEDMGNPLGYEVTMICMT